MAAAYYWEDPDAPSLAQKAWLLARRCETMLSLASLANFIIFLYQGNYRYKVGCMQETCACRFAETAAEHALHCASTGQLALLWNALHPGALCSCYSYVVSPLCAEVLVHV